MELFYALARALGRAAVFAALLFLSLEYRTTSNPLSRSGALGLSLLLVLFHDLVIYPRFLSPLRVYPEVKIRDPRVMLFVTDVPRGKSALEWAQTYPESDAVRTQLGLSSVIVPFSPRALRDILSTHQQDWVKPTAGRNFLSRLMGNTGLILTEGPVHARQRKSLTSSFRIQNIRALHGIMLDKTKLMLVGMEGEMEKEGKCDINPWASKTTLDIIGLSLMSHEFDSLRVEEQPMNKAFSELTAVSSGQTILFMLGMLLPKAVVAALPTKTNYMMTKNTRLIRQACSEILSAARGRENRETEILTQIMKDSRLEEEEIIDQVATFIAAGHETTATSIAWAMHLLTLPQYSHYQEKLRTEIQTDPDCLSSPTALETLPWLNAICEETFRLFPPVTNTARRAIRDTTVAGTRVPKNTMATIFPWAINRHPHYWGGSKAAEEFIPERWLDDVAGDGKQQHHRFNKHGGATSNYCETTFLHGNRACIGRDFAKSELRCIIAQMIANFEITRYDKKNLEVEPAGSLTIKPKGGLYICLKKVSSSYVAFVDLLGNLDGLARHGVEVDFHPVTVLEIHRLSGNVPTSQIELKGAYLASDSQRAAARVGKPNLVFPADFASVSLTASPQSALLYIKENFPTSTFLSAMHYLNHVFWTTPNVNISVDENLQRSLQEATESPDGGKRLFSNQEAQTIMDAKNEMKGALDKGVQTALQLGAFGLPWIVATNDQGKTDKVFGSDRFNHLYTFLSVPFKDIQIE